jgi:Fe-S oxidoreductase
MPLPIAPTLGILSDNLRIRKTVLPLGRRRVVSWADGLCIPEGGDTVIYTGQFYQMVPVIDRMADRLHGLEDSWVTAYFGLGRRLNRLVDLTPFMARGDAADRRASDRTLRNVALLLRRTGVQFGYLYADDLYSGALAYDEGLDEAFAAHAAHLYEMLKARGVKRLITVDPHTTNMFKTVYPRVVQGFDIETRSYLEVLADTPPPCVHEVGRTVTIHDSCIYARHEGIVEEPRRLLVGAGVKIEETEFCGALAQCCGGPAESLFPGKSLNLAKRRVDQLADCAPEVVTMCPLCNARLRKVAPAGVPVRDISDYLAEGYLPSEPGHQ